MSFINKDNFLSFENNRNHSFNSYPIPNIVNTELIYPLPITTHILGSAILYKTLLIKE